MPVLNRIADMADEMKGWRRHLHQYPELEFECHETAAFIVERLREIGVDEIHEGIARSGIVAMYAVLFFTIVWAVVRTKRWGVALVALACFAMLPIVALKTIPSLQQRIGYMRYDWEQYQKNAGSQYSDSERFVSLSVGVEVWKKATWLGVGAGDLPMEVQRVVNDGYPHYTLDPKLPHNQYLYILAGTGLLGLLLSLAAFVAPLVPRRNRQSYLLGAFQTIVFVSFLVEYTIETAIGVAFYLFYTLWFWKMAEAEC